MNKTRKGRGNHLLCSRYIVLLEAGHVVDRQSSAWNIGCVVDMFCGKDSQSTI